MARAQATPGESAFAEVEDAERGLPRQQAIAEAIALVDEIILTWHDQPIL